MEDLSFQPHIIRLMGMGFVTGNPSTKEFKNLFAVFYYVHHEQSLSEANEKLAKRNLRPATRIELHDFCNYHRLSLLHLNQVSFISTSPDDIQSIDEEKGSSLVPGIWKDDEDDLKFGNVRLDKLAGGREYIPGHQMFVVAIDESKSEI